MQWNRTVLYPLVALVVLGGGFAAAQDRKSQSSRREADRRAIDKLITRDMARAFARRDAAALAAKWTEEGEFLRSGAEPIRGRAEIEKGYAELFKTLQGRSRLKVQREGVRFPSADVAVAEVTLRLKNAANEIVASSRQNAVLVRQGGRWKFALVREGDRDLGRDASLKDLAWLLGTWRAVAADREVTITYAWGEHRAFLRGKFTVKEGGKVVESGEEVIGKDSAEGVIRSWVFQSDGGFGGGVWVRDGNKWSVRGQGVGADGRKLTGTTLYLRLDPSTFTWQAVNQALDGVPVADSPPIKVTKQRSTK